MNSICGIRYNEKIPEKNVLPGLTSPHPVPGPIQDLDIQRHMSWTMLCSIISVRVVVRVVNIGGFANHYFFIINCKKMALCLWTDVLIVGIISIYVLKVFRASKIFWHYPNHENPVLMRVRLLCVTIYIVRKLIPIAGRWFRMYH